MSGSCTIAISNSPVFSPSSSANSSSPAFFYRHNPFSCRVSASTSSPSNCSSPSCLALANGLRASFKDEDFPSTSNLSPPVPLKRKRPARLDIPNISLGFGGQAATPRGPAADSSVEEEKDGYYSVYCKRGKKRAVMEDRYCASLDLQDNAKQAFFGVFDGHGGCKAAEFAAKNIGKNIMDEVSRKKSDKIETNLQEAVKHGYLKTDSDFLKEDLHGGSCCVTALISNGDLVVSNAGDCRAVVSRAGTAQPLTTDHRPSRPDEKDRIEATGGYIDCYHGVWRIQGSLAVSRAIGDRNLKQWVISEPETKTHKIESDYEFLILASDGLWDKVTNQEAVDIARPICSGKSNSDSLAACKKLVDLSASRGSLDDISVMVIQLQHYNKRPARLDIPNISVCFGGLAVTPRGPAADSVFEEEGENGYYSVYCKRGKSRAVMEDRYCASLDLQDNPNQAFFGVFDGHGGCKAAEFAAKNIGKNIMDEVSRNKPDKNETNLQEAVKHGYLKTDSDFLKEDFHGGSCCVTALISNGDLVVSNAGDCRAVVSRAGTAHPLTSDHRPSRPDEKDRIEATGGYIDCYHGVWRIQGSLAVSRAIGDRNLKQWVISEPETVVHKIESDYEFLILASDGLWDKVTNQEAVDIARPICAGKNNSDLLAACKKLADLSASRGSLDDISVMVIQLQHYV
ncbi:hypothetical protein V2J09_019114 [Rumex salicifolius]